MKKEKAVEKNNAFIDRVIEKNVEMRDHWTNVFSNELIDRMSVIRAINDAYDESFDKESYRDEVTHKMMAIQPVEPKTGHWVFKHFDEDTGISNNYWCSECNKPLISAYKNFCSNCGIKMVEPQESEED